MLAVATGFALAGCGAPAPPSSLAGALARALRLLDQARTVQLAYTTTGHPPSKGTEVVGGQGVLERPSSFSGTFDVSESGLLVSVSLVVANGTAYLKLPFATFHKANLAKYGFPDPVALLSPARGLPAVFAMTTGLSYGGAVEEGGKALWSVRGKVPGVPLSKVLQLSRGARVVKASYAIDPATGMLLSVTLTGPFFRTDQQNDVDITLSKYGEHVAVRPPS
jgi:hypothetical protein